LQNYAGEKIIFNNIFKMRESEGKDTLEKNIIKIKILTQS